MGFLGMTAHWIEVKEKIWNMRAEVIGFKALSGTHSGENLGRYAVGLLDRVGIMSQNQSKASIINRISPYDHDLMKYSHVSSTLQP
jgi:hypothetical protein